MHGELPPTSGYNRTKTTLADHGGPLSVAAKVCRPLVQGAIRGHTPGFRSGNELFGWRSLRVAFALSGPFDTLGGTCADLAVFPLEARNAVHMADVTQIRNPGTEGRIYFERKVAEGKTKEAIRSMKRHISNAVYRHFLIDAR